MLIKLFLWYYSTSRGEVLHELLIPAGNMESLYQAVYNGADAVYVGCKNYGARKYADNFSNEEIVEAIKFCHLYGVRIYVTMNTLVKDMEVKDFLDQVFFLHKNGVDAIIMQDFGMICLVRNMYPNLEIHASTQANNSNYDTVKLFHDIGVKRVVFSREMSLSEINDIDINIEKEVFIHGALCVSYSGCCLMSSMIGGRSGNRGECAGSCRLPYSLKYKDKFIYNNKYLLSTRELNTAFKFSELLDSNIYSFKVEGRMKSPSYVGFITKFYRNLIDNNCSLSNDSIENDKLKTIYNREFTCGHLFNVNIDELINIKSPNHVGLLMGKVLEVNKKKIKIKLFRKLNQYDGIRFLESGKGFIVNYLYDEKGHLVNSCDEICFVDNKVDLKTCDNVSKTLDYNLMNELKVLPQKKIPVKFFVKAIVGEKLLVSVTDFKNTVCEFGTVLESAKKTSTSSERIKRQIEKLGDTPFVSVGCKIDNSDNVFINIKDLNELRRKVIQKLILKRKEVSDDIKIIQPKFSLDNKDFTPGVCAYIYNEKDLNTCMMLGLKRIYITDYEVYKKYSDINNIYFVMPRIKHYDIGCNNLVGDYICFENGNFIGDYGLNVTNVYTAYYLYKLGLDEVTLSCELSELEIETFINRFKEKFGVYPKIEVLGFGRCQNMVIKGNILSLKSNDYEYKLIDMRKREFPVYFDSINTYILNYQDSYLKNNHFIKKHADIRLQFFDCDSNFILDTVKKYK